MAACWCRPSKNRRKIARIPSWEKEEGECGMHPADLRMDPAAAQAVLQQFVALGTFSRSVRIRKRPLRVAVREQHYNLARAYLDARRYTEALTIFEELVDQVDPTSALYAASGAVLSGAGAPG
jgi:tetratricopeptide (TPR) repeat protein